MHRTIEQGSCGAISSPARGIAVVAVYSGARLPSKAFVCMPGTFTHCSRNEAAARRNRRAMAPPCNDSRCYCLGYCVMDDLFRGGSAVLLDFVALRGSRRPRGEAAAGLIDRVAATLRKWRRRARARRERPISTTTFFTTSACRGRKPSSRAASPSGGPRCWGSAFVDGRRMFEPAFSGMVVGGRDTLQTQSHPKI